MLSFIFKIWMSRALGAEVVGLYQIAFSVLMLLFTLTAGAPTVLSRKVAEAASRGDTKRQNALTTASLILGFGLSAVLCAVFYAFNSKLGFLFSDERCLPLFLIMLPTLITSTLYASFRSWFWGRKNFLAFSSTELLDEIIKIILSIVFAGGIIATLDSAQGIALALTVSDLACVLVLAIIFFIAGGRITKPQGFGELIKGTIPLSATRIITTLTASLTALIIPQMLVANGMSVAQATAEYGRVAGMAFPLIMAPVTLIASLSVVLIPDIAQLRAKGELDTVRKKMSGAMTFSILVASLFFVLYLPLGRDIGAFLFNDEAAGEFVSYCSLLLYPVAISQATTPMLNSLGKEKNTFFNSLIGAIFILPCIFFLPKFIGVYAMAVGSGGCFAIIAVLNLITLKKEVGAFSDVKKSFITVGFSIPLAILGMLTQRLLSSVTGNIVTIIVLITYLGFFMFLFVTAFDIVDVAGYVKLLRPASIASRKRRPQRGAALRHNRSSDKKHSKRARAKR